MRYITIILVLITIISARDEYADKRWGVAMVWGNYSIPYANKNVDDKIVLNTIPLFYYEGEHFYMHGTDYGIKLYEYGDWQFSALGRLRLLNIPKEYQNEVQGDKVDFGLRSRYFLANNQYIDIEFMENHDRDKHANFTYSANIEYKNLFLEPYTTLRVKDDTFNSHYYGLDTEKIKGDIDLSVGVHLKYQIYSNFYLLGGLQARWLGSEVQHSNSIDEKYEYAVSAGIGILNDKNRDYMQNDEMREYFRIAYGWGTPSDLGEILMGDIQHDSYDTKMTSIFYGYPLTDNLFNLPINVYISTGLVLHHNSDVQNRIKELDLLFKLYYILPIPYVDIRLGVGEGVSYVNDVVYIEELEMIDKGYRPSQWMNYLDISADIGLGVLNKKLEDLSLGVAIHHRSAIYEQSSVFGRIRGGTNYTTIYLQWKL